jgi:hypothetical protein
MVASKRQWRIPLFSICCDSADDRSADKDTEEHLRSGTRGGATFPRNAGYGLTCHGSYCLMEECLSQFGVRRERLATSAKAVFPEQCHP